jgi:hypothetical protein
VGDLRSDRPTVPILGPLLTRENSRRFLEALKYAKKDAATSAAGCVWLIPGVNAAWGMTHALPSLLSLLAQQFDGLTEDGASHFTSTGVSSQRSERHVREAFDVTMDLKGRSEVPNSLELLVVPAL